MCLGQARSSDNSKAREPGANAECGETQADTEEEAIPWGGSQDRRREAHSHCRGGDQQSILEQLVEQRWPAAQAALKRHRPRAHLTRHQGVWELGFHRRCVLSEVRYFADQWPQGPKDPDRPEAFVYSG